MNEQAKLKGAFDRLHRELSESSAVFNFLIILIIIVQVVIVANTELIYNSDSLLFYLSFVPGVIAMFFIYKKMVKNPLMLAIDTYVDAVTKSNLNGDELLSQKLLPTNHMLKRFSKYNRGLQREGAQKLFAGLKNLTFSTDLSQIDSNYHETIKTIKKFSE